MMLQAAGSRESGGNVNGGGGGGGSGGTFTPHLVGGAQLHGQLAGQQVHLAVAGCRGRRAGEKRVRLAAV